MDSYIDLKDIVTEELKHVDLDRVNVTCSPPDVEPKESSLQPGSGDTAPRLKSPSLRKPHCPP